MTLAFRCAGVPILGAHGIRSLNSSRLVSKCCCASRRHQAANWRERGFSVRRRFRAALGQARTRLYLCMCGAMIEAQWCMRTLIRISGEALAMLAATGIRRICVACGVRVHKSILARQPIGVAMANSQGPGTSIVSVERSFGASNSA